MSIERELDLIDLYLKRHAPREAARQARLLLQRDKSNARAQLRCGEALLMLGQAAQALAALPAQACPGEEARLASARVRAEILALRHEGARLWQAGFFTEARDLYARLKTVEEEARARFRARLDADPADDAAWNALVDAAGNYRLSHGLAGPLPDRARLRNAFLELVAGKADHAVQRHRQVVAATFRSLANWPVAEEIVSTVPAAPGVFQPSRFGGEKTPPVSAERGPGTVVRLREALAYNAGTYLWLCSADGNAPWLQEGMWGPHVASHLHFVLPPAHAFLEGEGLGTVLCSLAAAARRIDRPAVALGYWNNYGHVLHDIIPQLETAEAVLGRDFHILAVAALLPAVRDIFARAGYGEDRIVSLGEAEAATMSEVYCISPRTRHQRLRRFSSPLFSDFRHYDVALDDAGINFARRRLMGNAAARKAERKVYVSRRSTARHPDNEAEIEAMLAALGFEIVTPESMTFAGQVELFSRTQVLASLEGAALSNMMFMPPGGAVIALRSLAWGWTVNCFDELARIGKLAYTPFDFEGRQAPLDRLRHLLERQAFSATT